MDITLLVCTTKTTLFKDVSTLDEKNSASFCVISYVNTLCESVDDFISDLRTRTLKELESVLLKDGQYLGIKFYHDEERGTLNVVNDGTLEPVRTIDVSYDMAFCLFNLGICDLDDSDE